MTPSNEQQSEMLDLLKRTHAWIDELQVAGLTEAAIVASVQSALTERLLRAGGVEAAVEWFEVHGRRVRVLGPQMLAAMREQGH